jgi:putative ABC transport system ATP-binding protein
LKYASKESCVRGSRILSLVIETLKLKKIYMLDKLPVCALNGIDLSVKKGELISILGPSGCGKSTLLNMLGALDKPTEGKVLIEGTDMSSLNSGQLAVLRRKIGFVFQFFNLIPRYTAKKNVEMPLIVAGMKKKDRIKRSEDLLVSVGLKDRMNHKATALSGGEKQRVAIARALANSPSYLLMDEPTGNTDSRTTQEIVSLIKKLNQDDKVTAIIVTHDRHVAEQTNRILEMLDGRIVGAG